MECKKIKVKLSLILIKHHAKKIYGVVEILFHSFLTLVLDGGEWSASCPSCLTPGERASGIHTTGG
jgi:hypothetical protein